MTSRHFYQIFTVLCIFAISGGLTASHAEFYSYRDANGVLRFTDDMTEVPENRDSSLRRYRESSNGEAVAMTNESPLYGQANATSGKTTLETRAYSMHMTLNRQKTDLKSEYNELTAAQKKLKKEAEDSHTMSELRVYNEKASELNQKIQSFEQRRRAYEAQLNAFIQGN